MVGAQHRKDLVNAHAPVPAAQESEDVVTFPLRRDAPPTPFDLERISTCPLVQMFVVGRSGSGLVHAFLDGHPEVLHVPHTFKFYDFVAAHPQLTSLDAAAAARLFAGWPPLGFLFDSHRSVIIGGRLGPSMRTYVRVDPGRFAETMTAVLAGHAMTVRHVFLAAVLAYGWCIGQDVSRASVVFHHLHHGDWLWPERLIERSNYSTPLDVPAREILKADAFVLSLREPYDTYSSHLRFIAGQNLPDTQRVHFQEQFLRLIMQDWDRLVVASHSGTPVHTVQIEALRKNAPETMRACAAFLGIDPAHPALDRLTYYGLEWFGDIYTEASSRVHATRPKTVLDWRDRWYCDTLLAPDARQYGYPHHHVPLASRRLALSVLSAAPPAPILFDRSMTDPAAGRAAAAQKSRERVEFARRWLALRATA